MEIVRALTLSPEEAEILWSMDQELLVPPWTREQWGEVSLSLEHYFLLIAKEGDSWNGFALCRQYDDVLHLLKIATRSRCQRSGIGRQLWEGLIQGAPKEVERLFWEVATDNKKALAFYCSQGGKTLVEVKDFYGAGRNAWRCEYLFPRF
jgi:ribosomal protein S18 acetylase RimI-like enzyme